MISSIWDILASVIMLAVTVGGGVWYAFSRGKATEAAKQEAARKQADIDTMERINADNPLAGLPVDERLQRHTGKR